MFEWHKKEAPFTGMAGFGGGIGSRSIGTGGPLGTQANPAINALAIKNQNPSATSGMYWIQGSSGAFEVYCDMSTNGGGYMAAMGLALGDGTGTGQWSDTAWYTGTSVSGTATESTYYNNTFRSPAYFGVSAITGMMITVENSNTGARRGYATYELLQGYQGSSFRDIMNTTSVTASGTVITGARTSVGPNSGSNTTNSGHVSYNFNGPSSRMLNDNTGSSNYTTGDAFIDTIGPMTGQPITIQIESNEATGTFYGAGGPQSNVGRNACRITSGNFNPEPTLNNNGTNWGHQVAPGFGSAHNNTGSWVGLYRYIHHLPYCTGIVSTVYGSSAQSYAGWWGSTAASQTYNGLTTTGGQTGGNHPHYGANLGTSSGCSPASVIPGSALIWVR